MQDSRVALVSAALDYRVRELSFLHGLSTASKKLLVPTWPGVTEPFPAHHLLFSGYVALVLIGAKPCVAFGNGRWDGLAAALRVAVLEPWAKAHNLATLGFRLECISSALVPTEVPGHPGFFGWALLLNTRDPGYSTAVEEFLGGNATTHNAKIGAALGYPGHEGHATSAGVFYMAAEDEPYRDPAFPGEPICCVPLVEYRACRDDAKAVGIHFRRTSALIAAAPGLGLQLSLDLQDCEAWGPTGLAALCTAAFGGKAGLLAAIDRREIRMWPWMASGALQTAARLMPE